MQLKIKQLREQKGWSQSKLARKAGISRNYLSEIEHGKYQNIGAEILCKLAKALNCTLNDLVECDEDGN